MPDFSAALQLVLQYEGGRVDDPRDPGGRTAFGITQATFDAYNKAHGGTDRDVWTIVPAEVEAIYRERYATPVHFDALPDGVGFCVFDAAVNSGPRTATLWLQTALGVAADGAIGNVTLAAASKASAFTVINTVCDHRLAYLRKLSTWGTFGKGWTNRVESVRKSATAMVRATPVVPKPAPSVPPVSAPASVLPTASAKPWWKFW